MTSGITNVINAKNVTLVLDPGGDNETFITLQEISLPLSRPETREEVALGSVYFYGQHDNAFEAEMLLTADDVALYLDFNKLSDVGSFLETKPYTIKVVSKLGVTKTISVKAVAPHQLIDKPPKGGMKIKQYFRIVEDVTGSNVT